MSKLEQYRALTKQCLQILGSEEMKTATSNYTKVIQMGAEKAQRYILNETNKMVWMDDLIVAATSIKGIQIPEADEAMLEDMSETIAITLTHAYTLANNLVDLSNRETANIIARNFCINLDVS